MVVIPYEAMRFPEKLKRLLASRRISQESAGASVGVSQAQVSKWVRGINYPDIYQARTLATLLGVTLDYLADDSLEAPNEATDREREIWKIIRVIGPEEAWRRLIGGEPNPGGIYPPRGVAKLGTGPGSKSAPDPKGEDQGADPHHTPKRIK